MTQLGTLLASGACAISVGRIVGITGDGRVLVDFPENRYGHPIEARFLSVQSSPVEFSQGATVLMVFEGGDPLLPIILGPVLERISCLADPTRANTTARSIPLQQSCEVKSIAVLEAKDELLLRCGETSLTMKRDGKIVLKGRTIISRASRTNKIRGGSVAIN